MVYDFGSKDFLSFRQKKGIRGGWKKVYSNVNIQYRYDGCTCIIQYIYKDIFHSLARLPIKCLYDKAKYTHYTHYTLVSVYT